MMYQGRSSPLIFVLVFLVIFNFLISSGHSYTLWPQDWQQQGMSPMFSLQNCKQTAVIFQKCQQTAATFQKCQQSAVTFR